MKNQRFVLPLTTSNKAYFVVSEIRYVINKNQKEFGNVSIFIDMQYNPLLEDADYSRYMKIEEAERLLKNHGFIKVSDDFDKYDIESLKKIKSQLPEKWIENYNLWANYTG